jgi:hypothetical protein
MNAIIVNEKNKAKIETAIAAAQGRASVRCITYASVVNMCNAIESKLKLSKKAMDGVVYDVDYHAQHFPNAYKYIPESTQCVLTYKNGSWRVSDIRRANTRTANREFVAKELPQATVDALLDNVRRF